MGFINLAAADPAVPTFSILSLWPFAAMFAVFYFILIRPQQKKTKARNAMLASVQKGDKVTTIGGIHGTIVEITDDIVVLKVNDSSKLTFERSAINAIKSSPATPAEKE